MKWVHVEDVSDETVKKWHKRLFWFWVFPGIPVSIYLGGFVPYVTFLSVYTIITEHFLGARSEAK